MNSSRLQVEDYREGIVSGDRVILAKAITLMESHLPADQELADEVLNSVVDSSGSALRIGITGAPGVGKSTFIETFGQTLIREGRKVAVLTIDPSSQVSGGSILGDKTRMNALAREPNAFIRPSPSGTTLGGVALHTRESILLCEAAGFDRVIVETVGTGQSEFSVRSMVDFFLLLIQPGGGDELQGIKKGVVEMADAIAVTKSDGQNEKAARVTQADFQHALQMLHAQTQRWTPKVVTCSAHLPKGISEISAMVEDFRNQLLGSGELAQRRKMQKTAWFKDHFQHLLLTDPGKFPELAGKEQQLTRDVQDADLTPRSAAREMLKSYHGAIRRSKPT